MYHLFTEENLRKAAEMDEINRVPRTDLEVKLTFAAMYENRQTAASMWSIYSIHRELGKSVLLAYQAALIAFINAGS